MGALAVGRQDRADVAGTPPAELQGPLEGGEQRVVAVGCTQVEDLDDLAAQLGHPGRGGTGQERLRDRAKARNAFSAWVLGLAARRGLSVRAGA